MRKALLVLVAGLALGSLLWIAREWYRSYRVHSGHQFVVVEPGMRAPAVARVLVAHGVLAYRAPFLVRYWLGRPRRRLQAGEYLFDRPLRPLDVYRKLVRGEVYLHTVVIPEGSDRFDMARILNQQLGISEGEFLNATEKAAAAHRLGPWAPTLEGYLYPDTYRFPRHASAETVVATMLARFHEVLTSRFAPPLGASPETLHEVITVASLVEKETPDPAERPIIAGVFARRRERGWPLQCDPTVGYAVRLTYWLRGRSIGPITQQDLKLDSPYNTYQRAGLPPGPICSPGEASIRAALEPDAGNLLYFVSNNQGGHVFARTLAEHQRNVARYRRQVAALRRGTSEVKRHAR